MLQASSVPSNVSPAGLRSRREPPKPISLRTQDGTFISKRLFFFLLFLTSHLYTSGCKLREAPKYKSQVELKTNGCLLPALPHPHPLNCVSKQHGDFWTKFFCFTHTTIKMQRMRLVKCLAVSNSVPKAGWASTGAPLCVMFTEKILIKRNT